MDTGSGICIDSSTGDMHGNDIIWKPTRERREASAMSRFMRKHGAPNYDVLHQWSIDTPERFWPAVCDCCEIEFSTPARQILSRPNDIRSAGWFAGAELNFASHMLRHDGDKVALIVCREDGLRTQMSRTELRQSVANVAAALRRVGVKKGDRVAAILPNSSEAVIAMLATASIGAIWSSCSPDFGSAGIIDRFQQIEPIVLFAVNAYLYNGKVCDVRETLARVVAAIPSVQRTVISQFVGEVPADTAIRSAVGWTEFQSSTATLEFTAVEFDHPLYIMFSSGTTGVPKCIVHGHGGTLLQQSKELVLHTNVAERDTLFYFTTCGWMMWNWMVSGLGTGATLLLYDGSPFFNDGRILWSLADREKVSVFGTSAKYISALEKAGIRPQDEYSLSALQTLLSTGSPLAPESFDYVYESISSDILLASISGGTDILSCFALGNPLLPVRRGELQCKGLGMATEVFDDKGVSVSEMQGELVCTRPFPSTPLGFWNDPHGERYEEAYFTRFDGVWAHGDFAEITASGGVVIHGRSDSVLNPGGVRIGTAEIYRQVEKLDEVTESIVIGQRWRDDVRVVLFVVLRENIALTDAIQERIRTTVRKNTTPRHVPAKIVAVPEIPRTRSGKIVELAVRAVVHGEHVKNTEALANPDALRHFRDRPELAT